MKQHKVGMQVIHLQLEFFEGMQIDLYLECQNTCKHMSWFSATVVSN